MNSSVKNIIFASSNEGKFIEAHAVGKEFGLDVISPRSLSPEECRRLGVVETVSSPPVINEVGKTYIENAILKAEGFLHWSGLPALADDAGLEVEALGGKPGLHSARYAGEECNPAENIKKLLNSMKDVTDRTARFVCAVCLELEDGIRLTQQASINGEIGKEPSGSGGFGYDSVFLVEGYGETLATLKERGTSIKTHRVQALQQLFARLLEFR